MFNIRLKTLKTIDTNPKKIDEILTRGVSEVIDKENLKKRLLSGKRLCIKLGIDPTSPHIHIGRAVVLLKLKDFQDLGHKIVFIVGDSTGVIGDTSDKESERPMLSHKEVVQNAQSYIKQMGKVLNLKNVETHYNSEWLLKLNYNDIGAQADYFSVSDFIARENIKKRLHEGKRVSLREVLYPLMQGYDSVAIKADVELGGTDQRFNLLAGRKLQPHFNQTPQDILMVNLIMGTDGRKMSSSWGNTINITDEAEDMYGKNNENGQILLIVVITMIVALTVGLSIASRTVTELRLSRQNEESQRAFNAAEAGIDRVLKQGGEITLEEELLRWLCAGINFMSLKKERHLMTL